MSDDPLLSIIVVAMLLLLVVHFFWRDYCGRNGHSWAYSFHHPTQQERIRCQVCGRWAGEE